MNNRQMYNRFILSKIESIINKHPYLRFGQILIDSKILVSVDFDDTIIIKDPFYEESEVTWNRVKDSKFN